MPEASHIPDRLQATLGLDEPVSRVRLVSPARAKALEKLGIRTVRGLITHFPRRYIDLSARETAASARIGESCTIEGVIHDVKLKRPKPRLTLVEIGVTDSTGVVIVTAFRQPWLAEQLSAGMRVAIAGKIEFNYGFKRMVNPQILPLEGSDAPAHGLVIPVHPAGEKVTPALMRRFVSNALELAEGVLDPMPLELRVKYRLVSRQVAFRAIHFPESLAEAHEARRRLAYEEVLLLELHLMQQGAARSRGHVPTAHEIAGPRMQALDAAIPFTLTDEQQQARLDILGEMTQPHAMSRMLLGDVGTGKTVVAAGKGSTPEYALRYLLSENGIDPDADVTLDWKSEHSECVAALASGQASIALLPQPFVTVAQSKIDGLRMALDLTEEWDKLDNGSALITGVIVARSDFVEAHPAAVGSFLSAYAASVDWVNANTADAAALIGEYGIVDAAVAEKALPYCNIVCITGAELLEKLPGYLFVLYNADPAAVGGAMPDNSFYFA